MYKNFKKLSGILNTLDEIVEYILQNGIDNNIYLFEDILAGIDICESIMKIQLKSDIYEKMLLKSADIRVLIDYAKEDIRALDITKLEKSIELWSNFIIDLNLKNGNSVDQNYFEDNIYTINTDEYPLPKEGNDIYESRENFSSVVRGKGQPIVSIIVVAYNRLEKTKQCINSIITHTVGIDYELVLVDNGSSPEILDYYKSVPFNNKKIIRITKNMQLSYGIFKGTKSCNGKYIALLGNDIVVTKNWMENILKCFNSDRKIGMVCAMSSNISNLQQVNYEFKNLEDVNRFAEKFNISDSRKWHERLRLITAGAVYKAECIHIAGDWDYGFFHDFVDDDLSFHIRRAGYKTILCKDVFVHHDHIIGTEKRDGEFIKSLENGRENFKKKYYGVDAWEDVNNFELVMQSMIKPVKTTGTINVLGLDVRCGTPILEIKNNLRSNGVFDVRLFAHYRDPKYTLDLNTICEGSVICDRIDYICQNFENEKFDYILLGEPLNNYNEPHQLIKNLISLLNNKGQLLLKVNNNNSIVELLDILEISKNKNNLYSTLFSIDSLKIIIQELGANIESIKIEEYNVDKKTIDILKTSIKRMDLNKNVDDLIKKMLISNYVVSLRKSV